MTRVGRRDPWGEATAHLCRVDPRWQPWIERVGPCPLRPRKDRFGTLVRAIIGQQISTAAARSIDAKVRDRFGDPHTPSGLLGAGEDGLRSVGISGPKARYLLGLAGFVDTGRLPLNRLGRWDDETIVERLTEVPGIGRWTAEMFLIFALNRPDVLPVHDLGVRAALELHFELEAPPKPSECHALAEPWRPFRTVAMWYLWRRLDP